MFWRQQRIQETMDDTEAAEVRAQDAAVQAIAKASTSSPNKANTVADKAVLFP